MRDSAGIPAFLLQVRARALVEGLTPRILGAGAGIWQNLAQHLYPQPPAEVTPNGEEEYEVEKILDSRKQHTQVQYLVHWKGYAPKSYTWEPLVHLDTAMGAVRWFH
ncbi:hypothetical protein RhiJN_24852 [Ceratobasidium sp. AG-Ba]|nr:hypothetical protein RhiJN_24852 [Ceratobasidium sp. AG-Ba]